MTQEVYFCEIKGTLFRANNETMLDEAFLHKAYMIFVFGRIF
jgi:hypothetical protein